MQLVERRPSEQVGAADGSNSDAQRDRVASLRASPAPGVPKVKTDGYQVMLQIAAADGILDLSRTFVGRNGVVAAAKAAAQTANCTALIVRDHQVTSELLLSMLKELDGATHIERLDFGNNPITFAGGRDLSAFVRHNPNIINIVLDKTAISAAQLKTITSRVSANAALSAEDRRLSVEHFRQLRLQQEDMAKAKHRHRLTVSNVRLLHALSAGGSISSPSGELFALKALSEVIGGGYENLGPRKDDDEGSSLGGDDV